MKKISQLNNKKSDLLKVVQQLKKELQRERARERERQRRKKTERQS